MVRKKLKITTLHCVGILSQLEYMDGVCMMMYLMEIFFNFYLTCEVLQVIHSSVSAISLRFMDELRRYYLLMIKKLRYTEIIRQKP